MTDLTLTILKAILLFETALIVPFWLLAYLGSVLVARRPLLTPLLWLPVMYLKANLILLSSVVWLYWIVTKQLPPVDRGLYRVESGRPRTYHEALIRNPVAGFRLDLERTGYVKYGSLAEPNLTDKRWQWRVIRIGLFASFRCVWKYSAERYGEMYLGWKVPAISSRFAMSVRLWARVGQ